jgi:TonB family protein
LPIVNCRLSIADCRLPIGCKAEKNLAIGNWKIMRMRFCFFIFLLTAIPVVAQVPERRVSVAVIDFGDSSIGRGTAEALAKNLGTVSEINILDSDLTRSAARGAGYSGSLNMMLSEAYDLGSALGSDFFILGDAQTLRRSPSTGAIYFESYASIFLVSSRSGKLVSWQRTKTEAPTAALTEARLLEDISSRAIRDLLVSEMSRAAQEERLKRESAVEKNVPVIEGAPDDESSANASGLRLPRPYRRLLPAYPETAASAEAEATVDVLVDLDEKGEVNHVEIARWAGFGLDEATIETVRQLHFFPAMRNGTPIPLRVLLRYNFRKPAK